MDELPESPPGADEEDFAYRLVQLGLHLARQFGELEQRGLVERRRNTTDRRSYALYLTAQGRDTLRQIQAAGNRHQDEIGASLTQAERLQLASLLRRLATEQGITEDNLPGIPPRPPLANAQPRADRPARGPGSPE